MRYNSVFGINEDNLSNLCFEIEDKVEIISELFDKMDLCVEKISLNYKDSSCTELVNYYNNLKKSFPIIKSNLLSYSSDFIQLIKKSKENETYISSLFKEAIEENAKAITKEEG